MTGEITSARPRIADRGLKEKLLAAARGGMKTVLIPEENANDLVEISDSITKGSRYRPRLAPMSHDHRRHAATAMHRWRLLPRMRPEKPATRETE